VLAQQVVEADKQVLDVWAILAVGSKGRSSCDAGAMTTAPNYGDFALKRFLGLDIEQVASDRARAQITIADEHRKSQWSCPRCRLLRHGRGNDVVALRQTVLHVSRSPAANYPAGCRGR